MTTPIPDRRRGSAVAVSSFLAVILLPAVAYGLFSANAYRGYGQDLVLVSRAQDALTVLVLPLLVWVSVRSRRGSLAAHILWLGLLFYLAYSYAIYLIGWEENRFFLVYVLVVLVSAAAILDGLIKVDSEALLPVVEGFRTRGLGWFLVIIGVAFVGLWLSDVGPSALGGRAPTHVGPGGTPYAVYVLDLTVALPVVIVTGVMLIRRHPMAVVLGGVVLVKITTLFTALWLGVLAQVVAGESVALTPDMVPSAVLPVVTVIVLLRAVRRLGDPPDGWLHAQLWPCSVTALPPVPRTVAKRH